MISTPLTEDFVRGAAELEQTPRGLAPHRLPATSRQQSDPSLLGVEAQPSGVRIVFTTAASHIELVTHPIRVAYVGLVRPRGRIDVIIDGALHTRDVLDGGDCTELDMQTGASSAHAGPEHITVLTDLGTKEKSVEIWLPHNETVELVALRSDAPLSPAPTKPRRWVHHGSSISQGSNAVGPSGIWPVIAARHAGDVELRNLGFSGNALIDPHVARVIRDAPADIISVKFGINVVNADSMRLRAFVPAVHGFLDTIREGHPETPLLLASPIYCGIHENTPGPGAFDPASFGTDQVQFIATGTTGDTALGRLTLEVIRDALRGVVECRSDDPNLHYLDGLEMFGTIDAEALPLPDRLHPNAEAQELIGNRFADLLFAEGAPFHAPSAGAE